MLDDVVLEDVVLEEVVLDDVVLDDVVLDVVLEDVVLEEVVLEVVVVAGGSEPVARNASGAWVAPRIIDASVFRLPWRRVA